MMRGYIGGLVWLWALWASAGPESSTVVVCNPRMEGSAELASYYADRRGIDADRICALELPIAETMTREDFDRRLREPLLAWLREKGLVSQVPVEDAPGRWRTTASSVRTLVLMHGVPLRIADTQSSLALRVGPRLTKRSAVVDRAAVDSELSLVLVAEYPLENLVPNPWYGRTLAPRPGDPDAGPLLIVGRLDGPGVETVRRMIDDAVDRERYGLLGRACFDLRSITDRGYVVGDLWISEAYERMAREGYECHVDRAPGTMPGSVPLDDVAFYLGWYTEHADGPFRAADFVFAPGAVAYHLHSGAAATVRSRTRHWAGPLLARGAAAVMGAVYEPYLTYTPNLDRFTHHLCSGAGFGESVMLAQNGLSWQTAVVGDPLYRPFRYPLAEQVRHLEADGHPDLDWGILRQVNLLVRRGQFDAALRLARTQADALGSAVLWERLGDLLALNGILPDAASSYDRALATDPSPVSTIRITAKGAVVLRSLGKGAAAAERMESLRSRFPGHRCIQWALDLQAATEDGR